MSLTPNLPTSDLLTVNFKNHVPSLRKGLENMNKIVRQNDKAHAHYLKDQFRTYQAASKGGELNNNNPYSDNHNLNLIKNINNVKTNVKSQTQLPTLRSRSTPKRYKLFDHSSSQAEIQPSLNQERSRNERNSIKRKYQTANNNSQIMSQSEFQNERISKKCNSSLKKFLSQENSQRDTLMKNIQDEVDTMATYNSIDQKGMEKYLSGIRKVVQKSLFPADQHIQGESGKFLNPYNYASQMAQQKITVRRPSIDKVSKLAKAGGGADPLKGGRTNSSLNKESENAFQNYIAEESPGGSFAHKSRDSFLKLHRDSPPLVKDSSDIALHKPFIVDKGSFMNMDDYSNQRRIQSFKSPFSREAYLKLRSEVEGLTDLNIEIPKEHSGSPNSNNIQLPSQFQIKPVLASRKDSNHEAKSKDQQSSSIQISNPKESSGNNLKVEPKPLIVKESKHPSPKNKPNSGEGSPTGAHSKLPKNDYNQRHLQRLKTNISQHLNNDGEGYAVTGTIDNFFQFNEIGQIKTILREKFNLFQKRKSMYERRPLYKKGKASKTKLEDMDANFFNMQRDRGSTFKSSHSNNNITNNNNEEVQSSNSKFKITIQRASTVVPSYLDQKFPRKSGIETQQSKIKEEEENTSKGGTISDNKSFKSKQTIMKSVRSKLTIGLMKNRQFQSLINHYRGKATDRFYAFESDFVDTYELNEQSSIKEMLFRGTSQQQDLQIPFCKDVSLDKQNVQQLKATLPRLRDLQDKLDKQLTNQSQSKDLAIKLSRNEMMSNLDSDQFEKLLGDSQQIVYNQVYMNNWNTHSNQVNKTVIQLQSESRLNTLRDDISSYLTGTNSYRNQAEKYLHEQSSYRNKELQKLENSQTLSNGASVGFKKKMLDPYLKELEKNTQKEKATERIRINKKKQINYGKWYLQPAQFKQLSDKVLDTAQN